MLTLRQKQSIFAKLLPRLIDKAYELGFEVTLGETYRSPEEAARLASIGKGIKTSLHTLKLAIDLNLFKNGKFLVDGESHRKIGEWWEKQSTNEYECAWGGRFKDGNHYSIAHNGRK